MLRLLLEEDNNGSHRIGLEQKIAYQYVAISQDEIRFRLKI